MFTNNPTEMLAYAHEREAAIAHEIRTARLAATGNIPSALSRITQAVASHLGFSQAASDTTCCSTLDCC